LPYLLPHLRGQSRRRGRNVRRDNRWPRYEQNVLGRRTQRPTWCLPPAPARRPRETPEVRRPTAIAPGERESVPDTVLRCGCSSVKAATDLIFISGRSRTAWILRPGSFRLGSTVSPPPEIKSRYMRGAPSPPPAPDLQFASFFRPAANIALAFPSSRPRPNRSAR
jgi:hypothetical protein